MLLHKRFERPTDAVTETARSLITAYCPVLEKKIILTSSDFIIVDLDNDNGHAGTRNERDIVESYRTICK